MSNPTRKNEAIDSLTKEKATAEGLGLTILAQRCQEAIDMLRQPSRKGSRTNSSKRSRKGKR